MHSPWRSPLASLVFLLLFEVGSTARGAPDPALQTAKSAFRKGQSLYLTHQYPKAAEAFLAAYEAKPIAAFLFNAAVSFEKGKVFDKAVATFKRYLSAAPKAPDAEAVRKRVVALEKAIQAAATPPPRRVVEPPPRRPGAQPPRKRLVAPPPRRRAVVVPILPKIAPKGVVVVSTRPPGAHLYLNDKMHPLGRSPWQGSLATGRHVLIIESKGYKPERKAVAVSPDRLLDIYVALSQEYYLGWVHISANRPGAMVFIDDRSVGAAGRTPYTGFLKPGAHKLWVEKPGFVRKHTIIQVASGKTHRIHVTLQPVQHGWISVLGATASSGQVLLDGKVACKVPCDRISAQPGKHRLVVQRKGFKTIRTHVVVRRLRHSVAEVVLAKRPSRASAWVSYGVAAGFLGAGIAMAVLSHNLQTELDKDIKHGVLVSSLDGRFDKGRIYAYIANGLFGIAGISAAFGLYYTLADRGPKSRVRIRSKRVVVAPSLGPSYAGLVGRVRF